MPGARLCVLCFILIYLFIYECITASTSGKNTGLVGLEVIPERAEIHISNDKYVANNTLKIRRYRRGGPYVVNFGGIIKHTWDNNVTIDVILYEYLHNEYKRSFVEMHFKLCDLINKDPYLGYRIRLRGIHCPMTPGFYALTNATMSFPTFPYMFPFEKFMAEIIFRSEPSHEMIGAGRLYVVAKQVTLSRVKEES